MTNGCLPVGGNPFGGDSVGGDSVGVGPGIVDGASVQCGRNQGKRK